jgi:hippurate hydrolase
MVRLRRALHRHPELSGQEQHTAERVCRELEALGVSFRAGVGGHGIVADLGGRQPGPSVALRADLDALPIDEETGLSFSSRQPGVMHACGHDGHASMLVGAAALLVASPPLEVPVRLIWQPAEETVTGARAMIGAGVLQGVGAIFGGHVDGNYPPGTIVVTDGPVNASTDSFAILVRGRQGHGARPHEALDATVVGALLVTALQTIVSREVHPAQPAVVTVGQFHSGQAPNVISGSARLAGTIRAQDEGVRQHLRDAVVRMAEAVARLHGARVDVEVAPGTPPVVNRDPAAALARAAASDAVGAHRVATLREANLGGEDFAHYLDHVPGCYVRFGSGVSGRESAPAHSGRFDFDERALAAGAAYFARVAQRSARWLATGERADAPDCSPTPAR